MAKKNIICNECPYRKTSLRGYLGEASGNPDEFLKQMDTKELHPCHKAINWELGREELTEELKGKEVCGGLMQFAKNICKMLNDPEQEKRRNGMTRDEGEVFGRRSEFIKHKSETKSCKQPISGIISEIKR